MAHIDSIDIKSLGALCCTCRPPTVTPQHVHGSTRAQSPPATLALSPPPPPRAPLPLPLLQPLLHLVLRHPAVNDLMHSYRRLFAPDSAADWVLFSATLALTIFAVCVIFAMGFEVKPGSECITAVAKPIVPPNLVHRAEM